MQDKNKVIVICTYSHYAVGVVVNPTTRFVVLVYSGRNRKEAKIIDAAILDF